MQLRSISEYVRAIRPRLAPQVFEPARTRVLWLPIHIALVATLAWAMASGTLPAPLWPVASIAIAVAFSGVAFLGHETLHGAVIRGRGAIRVVGWFGFAPFLVSPTLWTGWHNRVHHNHCAQPGKDPDMYPTLIEYETRRGARIMADYFGLGRKKLLTVASLLFGFLGQSQQMLWSSRKLGLLSPGLHRRAIVETSLQLALWVVVALLVGWPAFAFVYVLPFVLANAVVMMFIMTNHNLSPLTPINDPLVNSLSVTLPRTLEFLTLDFGYHVEHHLFPTASTRHGRAIRDVLRSEFPGRYQSMPLTSALVQLYRTARVYKDDTTLIDPPSGQTFPTLMPRDDASTSS